eukprot:UN04577
MGRRPTHCRRSTVFRQKLKTRHFGESFIKFYGYCTVIPPLNEEINTYFG